MTLARLRTLWLRYNILQIARLFLIRVSQEKVKKALTTIEELQSTIATQSNEQVHLKQKVIELETRYKHLNDYKEKLEQKGTPPLI